MLNQMVYYTQLTVCNSNSLCVITNSQTIQKTFKNYFQGQHLLSAKYCFTPAGC